MGLGEREVAKLESLLFLGSPPTLGAECTGPSFLARASLPETGARNSSAGLMGFLGQEKEARDEQAHSCGEKNRRAGVALILRGRGFRQL